MWGRPVGNKNQSHGIPPSYDLVKERDIVCYIIAFDEHISS
jgi:hypothetical protein